MGWNKYSVGHTLLGLLFLILIVDDVVSGRHPLKAAFDGFFLSTNVHWAIESQFSEYR